MKIAEDFRRIARETLKGKWGLAVIAGIVASLLGGISNEGPQLEVNINSSNTGANLSIAGHTIFSTGNNSGITSDFSAWFAGVLGFAVIAALVMAVLYFVLGSFVGIGYAKFNLNLVDKKETSFETLFAYFSNWKTTAAMRLRKGVYILLWTLLFIIPGIIAEYSYAMTDYILAENPDMTPSEAIESSKWMMRGNRWRLFCLQFSFIGWDILATLTFGIGHLWLTPYKQAAAAAFYREVSGTEQVETEQVEEERI